MRAASHRIAAVALLGGVLVACGQAPLPPQLGGLRRNRVWSGERAKRMISSLHGKQVAPLSSTVAEYGRQGQLRVWLSRYPDAARAERAFAAMLIRLRSDETSFAPPRQEQGTPGRWFTVGPGGHNALWVAGATIYWVQGDLVVLDRALAELPPPSRGQWT